VSLLKYPQRRGGLIIIIIIIITVCRVLGLVTCSFPINNQEVFREIVLGFVAHTVDISQLRVVVCLCPFAE
jgi:flagellar basal body-associated protein FliL